MTNLLQRAQNRTDAHQFRTFYDDFAPRVKTYLSRHGAGPLTCERLARTCLLRAWSLGASSVSAEGCMERWIFVLARNLWLNGTQKEFVWHNLPEISGKADPSSHKPGPDTDRNPSSTHNITQRVQYLAVKEAVASLTAAQRDLLMLSYIEGLTTREMAKRRARSLSSIGDILDGAYRTIIERHRAIGVSSDRPVDRSARGAADTVQPGSKISHHPSSSTLISYASGALPEPFCAAIATHLDMCPRCRGHLAPLETVGGALLARLAPADMSDPVPTLALRTQEAAIVTDQSIRDDASADIPLPLAQFLGAALADVDWQERASGIWSKKLPIMDWERERVLIAKFAPGRALPALGAGMWEYAVVLQGFARGGSGVYSRGDVVEASERSLRKLRADEFEGCICLLAREKTRWGSRKLLRYWLDHLRAGQQPAASHR